MNSKLYRKSLKEEDHNFNEQEFKGKNKIKNTQN